MNGNLHTFIVLHLGELHISQSAIAKKCDCSVQMVNYVIMGRRKSASVQQKIARILGFPTWELLEDAAETIAPLLSVILNRPSDGKEATA
ncbi:helix-turn-helix transcriptional regulator [uncultured Sphaerochaeta sp.]|uniref:helix-turn-helix domain-containing protein n=1 Tax=uncultured Sphaerochaeta sp. TaxID=886478 RepID=UPI002A0A7F78|nr:helix-turn-helix transcriptional regulator [uncultured Sphaerochaeta sp.]